MHEHITFEFEFYVIGIPKAGDYSLFQETHPRGGPETDTEDQAGEAEGERGHHGNAAGGKGRGRQTEWTRLKIH